MSSHRSKPKTEDESLRPFLLDCQQRVEQALERCLPRADTHPVYLHEAMRYAVLGAGKRVRPVLVYAAGGALGVEPSALDGPACAVELIHAYSLVHDDLPAMDNSDLRRGRPTCHRAYDEATAVLAGDALQALAFHVLAHDPAMECSALARVRMIEILALAAGSRGMCGGQAIDLKASGNDMSIAELEDMHIHKTGALIRASIMLGALSADAAADEPLERLDHYGKCIGLAFQIRDDILDVEGGEETLGKTPGMDVANDKPTYVTMLGLDGAKERAWELHEEAVASLGRFGAAADPLRGLSHFIVERAH